MKYDFGIVGGGIVGLATARELLKTRSTSKIVLVEKERELCSHQSGRNSGVIHSGIYYKPGSHKAALCQAGNKSMQEFCREHGIAFEVCGKLIVATEERELPLLARLSVRAKENGIQANTVSKERLKELEPHAAGIEALHVPGTGIVSYPRVCERIAALFQSRGGEIRLGCELLRVVRSADSLVLETTTGPIEAKYVINCAGLYSDKIAKLFGERPQTMIIPFRGEYYELKPDRCHLVKNLIYPVPDPQFPFLGVHCTRMIDGGVHLGPNAVFAFKREGYRRLDLSLSETWSSLAFPGFWRLASRHTRTGFLEVLRSISKSRFVQSLQKLVPAISTEDVQASRAGVRAQALNRDGSLVDDFLIIQSTDALHVCNAPSPAATASLEIAKSIARRVP